MKDNSGYILIGAVVLVAAYMLFGRGSNRTEPYAGQSFERQIIATAVSRTNPNLYDPSNNCISWSEADEYVGRNMCVKGIVMRTFKDPDSSANFIDFGSQPTAFQGFSFKLSFDGLQGRCVIISGTIERYRRRTEIVINNWSQIAYC